jgi:GTP-binding protein
MMMAVRSTASSILLLTLLLHQLLPSLAFTLSSQNIRKIFTRRITVSSAGGSIDEDVVESTQDSATYYSPNVPLKYRDDEYVDDDIYGFPSEIPFDATAGSVNEYSFFDEAIILVRAGSGGQGSSTYKRSPVGMDGPPDGGGGGCGGNIILQTDSTLNSLAGLTQAWRPNSFGGSGAASQTASLRPHSFRAENGGDGDRQFKNGRYGKDIFIRVPPGTVVQEQLIFENDGNETMQLVDLGSLTLEQDSLVVAYGGEGGEGTGVQGKRGIKRARAPATGGERKRILLTLKIVADVALVGVPNAGKSTFLASVTRAKPKIANVSCCCMSGPSTVGKFAAPLLSLAHITFSSRVVLQYPFTTVIPNLGVWIPAETGAGANDEATRGAGSDGLVLCDVPGLIAGAASGVGLGHAFLRHVERCHVILHLVDATSNDPVGDFEMLNNEIAKYGTGQLAQMPQVVVVNKVDAFEGSANEDWQEGLQVKVQRAELEERIRKVMPHTRLMWMSAKEREGVDDLMMRLATFVKKVKQAKQ